MPESQSAAPVFALKDFSFRYAGRGKTPHSLSQISLAIYPGEKVALLGPSGAGKTTLLNALYARRPADCALQAQGYGLVDMLSVYHNIFIGGLERYSTMKALWNLVKPLADAKAQVEAIAETLGLREKLWHSVDTLSGGQRQRVAMGRALFRQQAIYLGDEPVSSIDPVQAEHLLCEVLARHETAVVSLHNRRLALEHFSRVIVLCNGTIVWDGASHQLSERQLDAFYSDAESRSPMAEPSSGDKPAEGWVIRSS